MICLVTMRLKELLTVLTVICNHLSFPQTNTVWWIEKIYILRIYICRSPTVIMSTTWATMISRLPLMSSLISALGRDRRQTLPQDQRLPTPWNITPASLGYPPPIPWQCPLDRATPSNILLDRRTAPPVVPLQPNQVQPRSSNPATTSRHGLLERWRHAIEGGRGAVEWSWANAAAVSLLYVPTMYFDAAYSEHRTAST